MLLVATACLAGAVALAPRTVSAENLFEKFFGSIQKQIQASTQTNFFADPFGQNRPPELSRPVAAGGGGAFCVRSCDGKYFPLTRGAGTPAQMCQAFCPASPTKVFYGPSIDDAMTVTGEHYAESENAFAYRKALRADCTCNGRDSAGLAPVDLTLDTSLRAGDVVATTDGLVAYSGIRVGIDQAAEFSPVASYPGLTADVRARLSELTGAPPTAEARGAETLSESDRELIPPVTGSVPKPASTPGKRAQMN